PLLRDLHRAAFGHFPRHKGFVGRCGTLADPVASAAGVLLRRGLVGDVLLIITVQDRVLGASALLRLGLRAAIAVANEVDFAFEFVFVRTLPGCLEIGLIRVRRVVLIDRHRSHVAMVLDEPLGFSHVDRANAAVVLVIVASKAIGVVIAVAVIV